MKRTITPAEHLACLGFPQMKRQTPDVQDHVRSQLANARRTPAYDDDHPLRSWIGCCVTSALRDTRRAAKRHVPFDAAEEERHAPGPLPNEIVEREELRRLARPLLALYRKGVRPCRLRAAAMALGFCADDATPCRR